LYKKDVFETIIQPTLATYKDYKVIFISTPRGKGEFYKIFNFGKTKENWISFQFPSSVNPLVNKEFLDSVKEEITERIFRQEYLAEFIEDGGEVFGNIKDCTKDLYYFNNVKSTRFWAGLDVGLKNDKTVLTVVDENYNVVDINQIKAKKLTEIATKVIDILKNYKDCKLYVETNFGSGLTEILKEKGLRNVYDFVTTTQSKKEMIEHLQMLFETKKISLPNYNNFLLDELINFTYKYNTSTRNITYSAPDGLHDDYVMSLAIACINRLKNNYNLEISFIHK
jgi:transposase-like protein